MYARSIYDAAKAEELKSNKISGSLKSSGIPMGGIKVEAQEKPEDVKPMKTYLKTMLDRELMYMDMIFESGEKKILLKITIS